MEILEETFFPQPRDADMTDREQAEYPEVRRDWHPITQQELVTNAIANLCNDKAPGEDRITNRLLKLAAPVLMPALTKIFNSEEQESG